MDSPSGRKPELESGKQIDSEDSDPSHPEERGHPHPPDASFELPIKKTIKKQEIFAVSPPFSIFVCNYVRIIMQPPKNISCEQRMTAGTRTRLRQRQRLQGNSLACEPLQNFLIIASVKMDFESSTGER